MPPDLGDRFFQKATTPAAMFGHGGSIKDPYDDAAAVPVATRSTCPGGHLVNLARWKNADYDKIVDEIYVTPPTDTEKMHGAVRQGDGDLAAGAAGHPADPVLPPPADEHDLLDGLPDPGKPVRQPGLLPLDLRLVYHKLQPTQ